MSKTRYEMDFTIASNNGYSVFRFKGALCTETGVILGQVSMEARDYDGVEIFKVKFYELDLGHEFLQELESGFDTWLNSDYASGFEARTVCERHGNNFGLRLEPTGPLTGQATIAFDLDGWSGRWEYRMNTDQSCVGASVTQIGTLIASIEASHGKDNS